MDCVDNRDSNKRSFTYYERHSRQNAFQLWYFYYSSVPLCAIAVVQIHIFQRSDSVVNEVKKGEPLQTRTCIVFH
jgi:hypothetical protein